MLDIAAAHRARERAVDHFARIAMAIRRLSLLFAFAGASLAFPITAMSAGDPALGAMLYVNPNGAPIGCANAACHGPNPAANLKGITRGADQPSLILNAINTRPEMMFLSAYVNAVHAEHLAAYIANPNGLPTGTIALSSPSLTFGNQGLSTTSAAQTVTVSNSGSNVVTLTAIATGGANPNEFLRSGTCTNGMSLAAGATCSIAATFTPALLGARSASVAIVHSGANSPLQIALSGNGVAAPGPVMSLSANNLAFGGQGTNTTSLARTITLSNTGPLPLTLNNLSVGGANASEFTRTGSCAPGASVATGQNCAIDVTFTPTVLGARTGTVNITSNAPGSPHSIALTGTGVVPAPAATLTSNSISFGNYVVGTTSPARTVTLTNSGSAPLTTSIAPPGAAFGHTTNCPATLAPNASCTISGTFSPVATGLASASIVITTNAIGSPHAISLSGNGFPAGTTLPVVTLSSSAIAFGAHSVNSASPATTVTLTNTDPATSLSISNLNLTGANAGDFSRAGSCSTLTAVLPGGSCTLIMTFTPTGTGARAASLTVVSNALGQQSIALSGTGTIASVPGVMLSPNALIFSSQQVGTASGQQVVLLSNTGNATLPISTVSATGEFSVSSTCGTSLAAATTCQIGVTFAPIATGARTGQVMVATGAAGSPHAISVSGTGMSANGGATPSGGSSDAGSGGGGGCTIGSRDDMDPILALMIFAAILGLRRRSRRKGMFQ
ncbi:MAG: choice-of-anchor D domain-containing protein [Burkholderiales bacterium]